MPWTIILENEKGEAIQTLAESLQYEELSKLTLPKFKLFNYVDPYGDTTFNRLQIDDLIVDLGLLKKLSEQKDTIDKIMSLAEKCKTDAHTYLKFYGD
ncbi:MAG: hypothetical protein JST26_04530 [Bacteroidetes bacterium]|nr:hypothetical protein [Bacteroidota bacterium]